MSSPSPELPALGSLAQAAREKHLRQGRNFLFLAGVFVLLGVALDLATAQSAVQKALQEEYHKRGLHPTPAQTQEDVDRVMRIVYLIDGGLGFIGALYFVFGFLIRSFPVPVTAIGLVLFVGLVAVLAVLNPRTLVSGWWIKLIVVIGLVKALQAAIAYQKEQNKAAIMESGI